MHAALKMIELAKSHPHELNLLCTGPLTNLGMAIRLEPNLPSLLNSLTIMGGSEFAKGNITRTAEFNFWADPEAAQIVCEAFFGTEKVKLITWECTLNNAFSWDFYDKLVGRKGGELTKSAFVMREATNILEKHIRSGKEEGMLEQFCPHDLYAAAVFIDPNLVKRSVRKTIEVELGGKTRGTCIIDWYGHMFGKEKLNCEIIQELE